MEKSSPFFGGVYIICWVNHEILVQFDLYHVVWFYLFIFNSGIW